MKFQLGGRPAWLSLCSNCGKQKGICIFSARFLAFSNKILTGNFRGLQALRPSQGIEALRPRPRTSKCVLEDVLEAKDVLDDSTSGKLVYFFHCDISRIFLGNSIAFVEVLIGRSFFIHHCNILRVGDFRY